MSDHSKEKKNLLKVQKFYTVKLKIPARMVFGEVWSLWRINAAIFLTLSVIVFFIYFFMLNTMMWDNLHCQTVYLQTWSLKFCCVLIYSHRMAASSGTCVRGISSLKAQGETEDAPDCSDFWDRASYKTPFPQSNMFIFSSSLVRWVRTLESSFSIS